MLLDSRPRAREHRAGRSAVVGRGHSGTSADKILKSRSALEGERRQVTVLFGDVAGFTTLAEKLDPEEVHRIINHCFELITAEVHRFEGTINQYTGDGIMALFGAPISADSPTTSGLISSLLRGLDVGAGCRAAHSAR